MTVNEPSLSLPRQGKAIVKQVLSGDTLVLRGKPTNGPPPELQLTLSEIAVPRLSSYKDSDNEEPLAWEAKEFVRTLLIGKEVIYNITFSSSGASVRHYGTMIVNPACQIGGESDLRVILLKNGFAKLRKSDRAAPELVEAELAAATSKLGAWSLDESTKTSGRVVKHNLDGSAQSFLAKYKGKALKAIVEQVRDGSTLRLVLILPSNKAAAPTYQTVTVFLSGLRSPSVSFSNSEVNSSEPFALEARFFTEVRLLNKDVSAILEGISGNGNAFVATIKHSAGNISEALLKEGLARLNTATLTMVSGGSDMMQVLRQAEKTAQFAKKRLWKSFEASSSSSSLGDGAPDFSATVVRVQSGDCVYVQPKSSSSSDPVKLFLSSIRQARDSEYLKFEAREFLRRKLVGKTVTVHIDYKKPAQAEFEARTGATVTFGNANVAEKLLEKGLVQLIYHRRDDTFVSGSYDALLLAEEKAKQEKVGVFQVESQPVLRIVDASENAAKARQLLPLYQKQQSIAAVVEHIVHPSRLRLYLPKEQAKMTLVLTGVRVIRSDTFSDSALYDACSSYVQDKLLQRDVSISVHGVDKTGAFIGSVNSGGGLNAHESLGAALLSLGYAALHEYSLRDLPNYLAKELIAAEKRGVDNKAGVYGLSSDEAMAFLGKKQEKAETAGPNGDDDDLPASAPAVSLQKAYVCEIKPEGELSLQFASVVKPERLEALASSLNGKGAAGLSGKPSWAVGDLCVAMFDEDKTWYRAKVTKLSAGKKADVLFIDFGNSTTVDQKSLKQLPEDWSLQKLPAQAQDMRLAFLQFHGSDFEEESFDLLSEMLSKAPNGTVYVQVLGNEGAVVFTKQDAVAFESSLNFALVRNGLATVRRDIYRRIEREQEEKRKQLSATRMHANFSTNSTAKTKATGVKEALVKAQQLARFERLNLWRFGDFEGEETL